jgi:hypothetical protein
VDPHARGRFVNENLEANVQPDDSGSLHRVWIVRERRGSASDLLQHASPLRASLLRCLLFPGRSCAIHLCPLSARPNYFC